MLDIPESPAAFVIPTMRVAVKARERMRNAGLMPSDERMVAMEFAFTGAMRRVIKPALPLRADEL